MASKLNGTLYIGITNDLVKRVWQHRNGALDGFTKRHKVQRLVYYEASDDVRTAIQREKRLKKWRRLDKIRLIESMNPVWEELYDQIL